MLKGIMIIQIRLLEQQLLQVQLKKRWECLEAYVNGHAGGQLEAIDNNSRRRHCAWTWTVERVCGRPTFKGGGRLGKINLGQLDANCCYGILSNGEYHNAASNKRLMLPRSAASANKLRKRVWTGFARARVTDRPPRRSRRLSLLDGAKIGNCLRFFPVAAAAAALQVGVCVFVFARRLRHQCCSFVDSRLSATSRCLPANKQRASNAGERVNRQWQTASLQGKV
ncbi:hypothetical protein M514_19405 [Trichuris suis]|uniref:Uncharacterized protein n=1 Tax=Trichuris suis TaxID=68888 RepID=A0A085NFW3_9BILA|nr:hypothetical protein M514_19405 [Trichuris suis]